jgi:hypothetical protein
MRYQIALIALSLAASTAAAQTGPSEPRLVRGSLYQDAQLSRHGDDRRVRLELSVTADGNVSGVRRLETSGVPSLDRLATDYVSKIHLVPALDAHGAPVAGILEVLVDGYGPYLPGPGRDRYGKELERIDRMRCQDFVWEYEVMRQIMGDGSMARERLMRTSLQMFADRNRLKSAVRFQLEANLDITARASAVQCYQRPEDAYWQGVFVPMVHAQMRRLGLEKP